MNTSYPVQKIFVCIFALSSFLLCPVAIAAGTSEPANFVVEKPYVGQALPGLTAKKFAPGLVSTDEWMEFGGTFSPDGDEFYFTRGGIWPDTTPFRIFVTRFEDGEWTEPEAAEFNFSSEACLQPWMTFDGKTLFFSSRQPINGVSEERTWAVQRQGDTWSEPEPVSSVVNNPSAFHLNMSRSGETIFSAGIAAMESGIFTCWYKDGIFSNRRELGPPISSDYDDYHGFISPDGTFMLFDSQRPGGAGERDLYVSFRSKGTDWTTPHPLTTALGSPDLAQISTITHDGRYLFFHADNDIYWVDIRAVRALGPTDLSVSKLKVKPKTVQPGDTITVKTLVKNLADIDASESALDLYLSENGKIDKNARLLEQFTISALQAGKKHRIKEKITLPKDIQLGDYYFVVEFAGNSINIDPDDTNNIVKTKKKVPVL